MKNRYAALPTMQRADLVMARFADLLRMRRAGLSVMCFVDFLRRRCVVDLMTLSHFAELPLVCCVVEVMMMKYVDLLLMCCVEVLMTHFAELLLVCCGVEVPMMKHADLLQIYCGNSLKRRRADLMGTHYVDRLKVRCCVELLNHRVGSVMKTCDVWLGLLLIHLCCGLRLLSLSSSTRPEPRHGALSKVEGRCLTSLSLSRTRSWEHP